MTDSQGVGKIVEAVEIIRFRNIDLPARALSIRVSWVNLEISRAEPVTDLNPFATPGIQGTVSNSIALVSGAMKSISSPKEGPEPLVERAQNGDQQAFEQIYREQVGRIHALCWRLTGDADLTEELTQEAFVRAWRKLHLFKGKSALSTWLHRLTVNVVMADHRVHGARRRRQIPLEEVHSERLVSHGEDAEIALELERAIATLPPRARSVFVLHDVEGYGHAEIAEIAGMATGTSKAHLHRARNLLREALLK
jgi:RNA polymerase sigma-70 factor (ECF subfamily)